MVNRWSAVAALAATIATPTAAACRLERSPALHKNIVMREAERVLGDSRNAWDLAAPSISTAQSTVRILIRMRSDAAIIDPPYFVILVENCGKGPVRSGLQDWDVAMQLRPPPATEDRPGYLN